MAQTTKNTVSTEVTKVNLPENIKVESQFRPKVNVEKLAAIKQIKDLKIKTNQIVRK